MRCRKRWMVAVALTVLVGAGPSRDAVAQGIYTCVDAKGRKITADRPIAECMDRTQKELNRTGTIRRELPPVLTAEERAAQEAKDKQAAEARAREAEEKRRERALLQRYPDRASHDRERAAALAHIDEVIKTASSRTPQLASQRKALDGELEFYASDPSKVPASLKRRIEEHESGVAAQKKFIQDQEQEKKRINARFDEELVKLKQLWAMTGKS
ncbi:DUF4124 domain-containing protein [Polaromonas sp. YR568]|uniref:DUF4124 domain-containing protein n=1 Tax=Polaromonas sp. YR568 TaxID=1855301 RepID=UPI0031379B17